MWDGYFPESMSHVFTVSQLSNFIEDAVGPHRNVEICVSGHTEYFNIPASFDIEASSWSTGSYEFDNVEHFATMYIWQFGLNGSVIYGRRWDEFDMVLDAVIDALRLCKKRHLVIYVHNLGYEFQWIRKKFEWDKVFAIKRRRPVYAISGGLEFRCSYFLSNYALAYIGDNLLIKYPIKKLVGALDYNKVRHSLTPLTASELAYCVNDVKVVMSYIQEKIENDGDITQIPLTNTGYVRNYCRESCFYEGISPDDEESRKKIRLNYQAIMKSLQVQSDDEYYQLKRAFMGGFTHTSILHSNQLLHDIGSADLTSSYPYTMVAQYFPMTRFKFIGTVEIGRDFKNYLNTYCCIFDIEFFNLRPNVEFENILSASRCHPGSLSQDVRLNNGRVISCSHCSTTLTELDFENMCKFYIWDECKIVNLRISHRGYLPKAMILAVLDLYESKTSLKGIAGKEVEYLVSKNMINAAFGMMVTNIIRDEFTYDNIYGWLEAQADVEKQLNDYNRNFNRFLYYGWGVWVTAHARHNLFSAIWEFGDDYVYADTDSIKGFNFANHMDYFKRYNNHVLDSLIKICAAYNIPFSKVMPKTNKGIKKILGVWEIEEGYKDFKAVGAKRYMYRYDSGKLQITVGGLNKSQAVPYLLYEFGGGKLEQNEARAYRYLQDHNLHVSPYYTAFQTVARIAYSNSPEAADAMAFIQSLSLFYEHIFDNFGEGLCVPAKHTGKQTVDYIDKSFAAICYDYIGLPLPITETSAVYMEAQNYQMSITGEYRSLLEGVMHVQD